MQRSERDTDWDVLCGSLKQLVTRLPEAELIQLQGWLAREIPNARSKRLRLLGGPSHLDRMTPDVFEGTPAERAGAIRRALHDLPEDSLIQLQNWILGQLKVRRRDL